MDRKGRGCYGEEGGKEFNWGYSLVVRMSGVSYIGVTIGWMGWLGFGWHLCNSMVGYRFFFGDMTTIESHLLNTQSNKIALFK